METFTLLVICICINFLSFGTLEDYFMNYQDRWDSLIQYYTAENKEIDWLFVKAVMEQESGFNARAESPVGAGGLLQLMPLTAKDLGVNDVNDPEDNIRAGVTYLKFLYNRFDEIKDRNERLKFTLGSYNAGRGHINKMLALARRSEGLPYGYNLWLNNGAKIGEWNKWDYSKKYLKRVTGRYSKETLHYVDKIMKNYKRLKNA